MLPSAMVALAPIRPSHMVLVKPRQISLEFQTDS